MKILWHCDTSGTRAIHIQGPPTAYQSLVPRWASIMGLRLCCPLCSSRGKALTGAHYSAAHLCRFTRQLSARRSAPCPEVSANGLLLSDSDGACAVWEGESQLFMSPPVPVLDKDDVVQSTIFSTLQFSAVLYRRMEESKVFWPGFT
ncbi:hypothetical protein NQZ68_008767 [Dissostichus eleginoides]|nr:hypothetical protein NQZ68_008767 [Dissostichus eleginoides]